VLRLLPRARGVREESRPARGRAPHVPRGVSTGDRGDLREDRAADGHAPPERAGKDLPPRAAHALPVEEGQQAVGAHDRALTPARHTIESKPSEPGESLELTIDIEVQRAVEQILAGPLQAAAAVIDVNDGSVLAIGSNRLFDPNDFTPPGNAAAVRVALQDNE